MSSPARPAAEADTRQRIQLLLERHGLAAHRDRGQNFLADASRAQRLVEDAGVEPGETVIEIGTGLGILTRALAARAARVITIEVDAGIVRLLEAEGLLPETTRLIHADALELDFGALAPAGEPLRVVANLPYSVATPLLRRLLALRERLQGWSVLVQREVALRITAATGTSDYGSLAVLHGLATRSRRGLDLSPACFYPVPRVTSTFVHLAPRESAAPDEDELRQVERVARAAFQHRRKTLSNALRTGLSLSSPLPDAVFRVAGVSGRMRPAELDPESWRRLAAEIGPESSPTS